MGQQLVKEIVHQLQAPGLQRRKAKGFAVDREGVIHSLWVFGQMHIFRELKPTVHVAKAILVWHKLDKSLAAIGIQRQNFLAGHWAGILPHNFMAAIGKGMLGIKLQLVELERGEEIHQFVERFHRRHTVARNVKHNAAIGIVGPVNNLHRRQREIVRRQLQQLAQRTDPIECARAVIANNDNPPVLHQQLITLAAPHLRRINAQANGRARCRGRED